MKIRSFGTRGYPPCDRDCPNRSARCHAQCEKYLTWKAKTDKLRDEVIRQKGIEIGLSEVERKKVRKRR